MSKSSLRTVAVKLKATTSAKSTQRSTKIPTAAVVSAIPAIATKVAAKKAAPKRAAQFAVPTVASDEVPEIEMRSAPGGKLGQIFKLLERSQGCTLTELMAMTGWQAHSVRGALSTLKKRLGRPLESELLSDGLRHYRLSKV